MEDVCRKKVPLLTLLLVSQVFYRLLPDFSLLGITVSFSRLGRAIGMTTPPFRIMYHAEGHFQGKPAPSSKQRKKKNASGSINKSKKSQFSAIPKAWPLQGIFTSPFGYRINPISGRRKFHAGIDIAAPQYTKIRSPGEGNTGMH